MPEKFKCKSKIKLNFNVQNIGPHDKLSCNKDISSLKIGIYASNGMGKTFLSRMFRLTSDDFEFNIEQINRYISLSKNKGEFNLKINHGSDPARILDIDLSKNKNPIINNSTGYIFHVFNNDFVNENLVTNYYNPNGNIEGYIILGKDNIDISKLKEKLKIFQMK